jgi:uncharacterized protein (TIGR03435 family)
MAIWFSQGRSSSCAVRIGVIAAMLGGVCCAQTPHFEVASVKPATAAGAMFRCTGGPGTSDPGTLTCTNYALSYLVMMAYHLHQFQLTSPSWMETARYDVTAKIPPGTDTRQFELMQQALLAERFALQCHFGDKAATVYELVVAKGGPKLTPTKETPTEKPLLAWRPPPSGPPRRTKAFINRKGESMPDLATFLSHVLGNPVTDSTGLQGLYDYSFTFEMEPGGRAAGPPEDDSSGPELGVSLPGALREQLGLELKRKKGQARVLVIDHAEKVPVGN